MDFNEINIDALKEAFEPIHAAVCGEDQQSKDRFNEHCGKLAKDHAGIVSMLAAFGVYQHARVDPALPLTVIDPFPRPWYARWFKLKPKRVVFSNAIALAKIFEVAVNQSASLSQMTGILVYHHLFMARRTGPALPYLGMFAAWRVNQEASKTDPANKK